MPWPVPAPASVPVSAIAPAPALDLAQRPAAEPAGALAALLVVKHSPTGSA